MHNNIFVIIIPLHLSSQTSLTMYVVVWRGLPGPHLPCDINVSFQNSLMGMDFIFYNLPFNYNKQIHL